MEMIFVTDSGTVMSFPAGSFVGRAVSAASVVSTAAVVSADASAAAVSCTAAASVEAAVVLCDCPPQPVSAAAARAADRMPASKFFFFIQISSLSFSGHTKPSDGSRYSRRMADLQNHKARFL